MRLICSKFFLNQWQLTNYTCLLNGLQYKYQISRSVIWSAQNTKIETNPNANVQKTQQNSVQLDTYVYCAHVRIEHYFIINHYALQKHKDIKKYFSFPLKFHAGSVFKP